MWGRGSHHFLYTECTAAVVYFIAVNFASILHLDIFKHANYFQLWCWSYSIKLFFFWCDGSVSVIMCDWYIFLCHLLETLENFKHIVNIFQSKFFQNSLWSTYPSLSLFYKSLYFSKREFVHSIDNMDFENNYLFRVF